MYHQKKFYYLLAILNIYLFYSIFINKIDIKSIFFSKKLHQNKSSDNKVDQNSIQTKGKTKLIDVESKKKSNQFYEIKTYFSKNEDAQNSYATIVSMYFQLKSSKHSSEKYSKWNDNFFQSVNASPLVIFTDHLSVDAILKHRQNLKTTFYICENIWTILKDLELERNQSYLNNYLNVQNSLDPEKNIHNPNLYAIWNLKSFIISKAAEKNIYNSKYFIYSDSGAWRQGIFPNWPNIKFIKSIDTFLKDRILFAQIYKTYDKSAFPVVNLIEGGFFMGTKNAVALFKNEFWRLHDLRMNQGLFIGKDQTIMNLIAFQTKQKDVVRLKTFDINCQMKYNEWFFYQYYFASNQSYKCDHFRETLLLFNR